MKAGSQEYKDYQKQYRERNREKLVDYQRNYYLKYVRPIPRTAEERAEHNRLQAIRRQKKKESRSMYSNETT